MNKQMITRRCVNGRDHISVVSSLLSELDQSLCQPWEFVKSYPISGNRGSAVCVSHLFRRARGRDTADYASTVSLTGCLARDCCHRLTWFPRCRGLVTL